MRKICNCGVSRSQLDIVHVSSRKLAYITQKICVRVFDNLWCLVPKAIIEISKYPLRVNHWRSVYCQDHGSFIRGTLRNKPKIEATGWGKWCLLHWNAATLDVGGLLIECILHFESFRSRQRRFCSLWLFEVLVLGKLIQKGAFKSAKYACTYDSLLNPHSWLVDFSITTDDD